MSTEDPDSPTETRAERDRNGRFLPGNGTGRLGGRPPRAVEEEYLRAISETVPPEKWKAAVSAVYKKALEGDVRAFEALAKYVAPPEARSRVAVEAAGSDRREDLEDVLAAYFGEGANGGA